VPDTAHSKAALFRKTQSKRKVAGQRKRFNDSIKVSLKDFSFSPDTREALAVDHPSWRSATTTGAKSQLKTHVSRQQNRNARGEKSNRGTSTNSAAFTYFCPALGGGSPATSELIAAP
jgi:hypothetical protein